MHFMVAKKDSHSGFTLVELVITIIVLGILAVTAVPKLLERGDVDVFTFQARLIASLRNMQIRAMQDTRVNFCFQVNFINANGGDTTSAFGPPLLQYNVNAADANPLSEPTCSVAVEGGNAQAYLTATAAEMAENGVLIQAFNSQGSLVNSIAFDSLGRPQPKSAPDTNAGTCATGCVVNFTGEVSATMCIESEGFVHPGSCGV